MKKTNWIEKIKEGVRVAMNKGLRIKYSFEESIEHEIILWLDKENTSKYICITIMENIIYISTPTGCSEITYSITDRDDLELRALGLSIKEYNEDMAIFEFEEFISSDKNDKPKDINDLDDKDD